MQALKPSLLNNTLYYTKENGIIQIFEEIEESPKFIVE